MERLEKKLLASATRQFIATLDQLLADNCKEFGKSDVVYTKQDILNSVPNEETKELNAKAFKVGSLGDTAHLVTLVTLVTFETLEKASTVLRSSIWQCIDGRLYRAFHQGTVIQDSAS